MGKIYDRYRRGAARPGAGQVRIRVAATSFNGVDGNFLVDRHYLLCASAGVLRLEARGQTWLPPPARAALIEAGQPIQVSTRFRGGLLVAVCLQRGVP
ncbi:hypothetical protein [Kineosporia sp. NBRC 101731]|uniref:hypothetical protein n=1 Tax=Kineosporia sp. NBRC 101731 TaxID=3032199 RepID=UPI0024A3CCF3|nr:hypothetical protein [Kineosporia sp. NBRC 101731]GLY32279.1 hypothetical protein Kisp02_56440 [Kineosporia sp. NBRC 101731]